MSPHHPKPTESAISVFVIANYQLVRQALRALIASNSDISVIGTSSFDEASKRAGDILKSQVAIVYYSADNSTDVVTDLLKLTPGLRIILVIERDDLEAQATAIKRGAVGIVHKEQNSKMLVEAIRQTSRGDTWLSQRILNKVLVNERNRKGGTANYPPARNRDALTPRELEVTRMIGDGLKNKEIARRLFITESTVRHHLSSIYGKLGVEDRLNLVILAHNSGLIHFSQKT